MVKNELICTIENLFDDFTIHPSGAYVIEHMGDTAFVFPRECVNGISVIFGGHPRIKGTESEMANALRSWRNRPQL